MFGFKQDDLTGEWRRLHNQPRGLYSVPTIIWAIRSRRMTPAGQVAQIVE